jgi:hypothetical protein
MPGQRLSPEEEQAVALATGRPARKALGPAVPDAPPAEE